MADTPGRLLNLLSLLQTPREWPGSELAERLAVSPRTIRRDIDRLRSLGYPVEATKGAVGGYRLVAGKAMPPLVLDDEEAVAIAVGLRAGAGHAVEGVEEASVRALTKLEQVLPPRLRHRVSSLQNATLPLTHGDGATVSPSTLTAMASAVSATERLRFCYRSGEGAETKRHVEPYRLVSTGQRWYLVAYDLDREDWRTFRVDRVSEPQGTGARFVPQELPADAENEAEFLAASMGRQKPRREVEVSFRASAGEVGAVLPPYVGVPEATGPDSCALRCEWSESLEWLAVRLAMLGFEFRVLAPGELKAYVKELGGRLSRAAGGGEEPVRGESRRTA